MRKTLRGLEQLLSDYQHARILRLTFPHNDAPLSELLVNKLDASEGLSRNFALNRWRRADNARTESGNPRKYNEAMLEMLEYFKCLHKNGLLN